MKFVLIFFILSLYFFDAHTQEIEKDVLKQIRKRAKETHSDALIIIQNNKPILQDFFSQEEKPIYIASAGKSLTALAIGKLIDKGLIDSLDQCVADFFSEWKQGNKKDITIRMLLNHTSGIQNNPNASVELEPPPDYKVDDVIKLALASELSNAPGKAFNYNNKAVALLGGLIEKVSGKRMDIFFKEEFFDPMGITDYDWIRDRAGNPTAHGAFVIKPSDFAKFGKLLLNNGVYEGVQLISPGWIEESFKQGQQFDARFGLLWWRLPAFEKRIIDNTIIDEWKTAGVDKEFIKKFDNIIGKEFQSKAQFYSEMELILGKNWNQTVNETLPNGVSLSRKIFSEKISAYYANGFRGNYLVVVPELNLVAVRCADNDGFNYETDSFDEFPELVSKLRKQGL